MTSWTKEQVLAIESRKKNLLVAAGAGSGKTAVLTERIKKMILEENVNIDEILVVTFTNLAAAQMRERINNELIKFANENKESSRVREQLLLSNKANITTLHSFCLEVIRNNFYSIDIDPQFRIGNDMEIKLIKEEVLEDTIESYFESEKRDDIEFIMEYFGRKKNDIYFKEIVLKIYNFAISNESPEKWLKKAAKDYELNEDEGFDFFETTHGKIIKNIFTEKIDESRDILKNALYEIDNEGIEKYILVLKKDMELINNLKDCASKNSFNDIYEKIYNDDFSRMPAVKEVSEEIKNIVKNAREAVKKNIKTLRENIFNDVLENKTANIKESAKALKLLTSFIIEFKKNFGEAKKERNLIDFNDIEHFTLKILQDENENPTEIAKEYKEKFHEVLIDEYQDINSVQERILTLLSKDNNMFMVGDVKQSIYKFRHARPEIFMGKYENFSSENSKDMKISLSRNFRSSKNIIDCVNTVFESIMSKEMGELDYNEEEKLIFGNEKIKSENTIEIDFYDTQIDESLETEISDDDETLENVEIEARIVAQKIKYMIQSKFKVLDDDGITMRDVKYSDIVILMRSTSTASEIYKKELNYFDIDVYEDINKGYFDNVEVRTIISLLQIIDNPNQDIPLLAVLLSPMFDITEDEIAEIRIEKKEGNIYSSVYDYFYKEDSYKNPEITEKLRNFFFKLEVWRNKATFTSIDQLIWNIYQESNYYAFVLTMKNGAQRQANLRLLFEKAKEYEKTNYKGLFNFVNYINKVKKSNGDFGSAKILGSDANVVRIMSIHKSKGLEFPVVFLVQSGKGFNFIDMRKDILLHQDIGIGIDFIDIEKNIFEPTIYKESIKLKLQREILSEEMRILYVALTRAKEKLIVVGTLKGFEKKKSVYMNVTDEKIKAYKVESGKNYLDWILMAVLKGNSELYFDKILEENKTRKDIFEIKKWNLLELKDREKDKIENKRNYEIKGDISQNVYDEIDRRLTYKYKYEKLRNIPTKLTVTEIKKINADENSEILYEARITKPNFIEKKKISASEIGTATHKIVERLDYSKENTYETIKNRVNDLVLNKTITQEESESISIEKISNLFKSKLGEKLIQADKNGKLKRETEFYIEVPVSEIYPELESEREIYENEKVQIQGVIDAYIEEDDGIILIDYKTDYVKDRDENILKDKYNIQMVYYKRALEYIETKKVKKIVLYSFFLDKEVELIV